MDREFDVSVIVSRTLPLAGFFALAGCAGAQLERQAKDNAALREDVSRLTLRLKEKSDALDAATAAKADLEAKLAIAGARVDSLTKSNKELSDAIGASQNDLGAKLNEAVAEKDALAKKLADAEKEALSLKRARNVYRAARDKDAADLAKMTREREALAAQWKTVELGRQDQEVKRAAAAAKRHEDMGSVVDVLLPEMQAGKAGAEQGPGSFSITLSDALLFDEGSAKIRDDGAAVLERVGRAVKALGDRDVSVSAHTDNGPIKKGLLGGFDDHWSLSAARAAAVAHWLHEHSGLDPSHLSARGYGEFRPVKPNDSDEDRAANRRVVIEVTDPLTK